MRKDDIKRIIIDFQESNLPEIKTRLLRIPINSGKIVTLSGVRRSGKTYNLLNVIKLLKNKKISIDDILYINFEDERFSYDTLQLNDIIQAYRELYPDKDLSKSYFLFDEVQAVEGWQKFIRRVYDTITKNIFITGSNSKLLSREISTSLRGRNINFEIFPLNFREYLFFLGIDVNLDSSKSRAQLVNLFMKFLNNGGFPETVTLNLDTIKRTLQEYFNVMIFRDLIERYDISQTTILKYFCKRVIGNSSKEFSVNKIYNELKSQGYKVSKDTLYQFQDNIESIYLALFLSKYSNSIVKSEFSQKKVYAIDTGLASAMEYKFSQDIGRTLENLIFLELVKSGSKIYYYKNRYECDFILQEGNKIIKAIQVSLDVSEKDTKTRESRGLIEACKDLNLKKGYILTLDKKEQLSIDDIQIEIIPAYEYLLQG